jgi:transcription initiation factor TFIID TATA-box-binding protein
MIRNCGYDVNFKEFKIQNVVGVADVNFPIRLEALQIQHKQFCQYEPEVFPGAIYKKDETTYPAHLSSAAYLVD